MRSAEEWVEEITDHYADNLRLVREIQRDAIASSLIEERDSYIADGDRSPLLARRNFQSVPTTDHRDAERGPVCDHCLSECTHPDCALGVYEKALDQARAGDVK